MPDIYHPGRPETLLRRRFTIPRPKPVSHVRHILKYKAHIFHPLAVGKRAAPYRGGDLPSPHGNVARKEKLVQ